MPTNNYPNESTITPPNITIEDTGPAQAINSVFPPQADRLRLSQYDYFANLFTGNHFEAFNIKIGDDERFSREWKKLRYTVVNFAGLISKITADMLFSEPIAISVPDGDQEYVEGLWRENNMDAQCYESALSNSYLGDALFKLRIGRRTPADKKTSLIIEDITPRIYFPNVDDFNVRAQPDKEMLAWVFEVSGAKYVRMEIHTPGKIENKVYNLKGDKLGTEQPLTILGGTVNKVELTRVDFSLLQHVVNWKTGDRHFGISDYYDLDSLFYAINNRMSKVDNILDKHSDPILTVPPGILDEKGRVKKSQLGVIEIQEGETGKPEYVVWDASLDNAFKQIEKLTEFMYMVGEVSPDVLGLGEGVSDSGRALKFKLMRTIAKVARKKLYYDYALKQMLYKAQVLAKAWGTEVEGKKLQGEPVMPEIEWADGLPEDMVEQLDNEIKAVDAGLKSKKDAIISLYNVDEATAEKMVKEKDKETVEAIRMNTTPDFKPSGQKPPAPAK
jgi:hypothetical protein